MFKNSETAAMLAAVPTRVWWQFHRCPLANLISVFVLKGSWEVKVFFLIICLLAGASWVNLTFMGLDSEC